MVTIDCEPLVFQNVILNAAIAVASPQNIVFSEDCVATVSETGHVFVRIMNLTSNPHCVRGDTHLGTVVPVSLVYTAVPQLLNDSKPKTEVNEDRIDFVFKVNVIINLSTESQFTSSSEFGFPSKRISPRKVFRTVRKGTYRPNLYWTLTPVLWLFLVFYTSGKVLLEIDVFAPSYTVAKN